MDTLIGKLRLPSLPTLGLYAATVAAEAPVIVLRMFLSIPVLAVILLIKGQNPEGAVDLVI